MARTSLSRGLEFELRKNFKYTIGVDEAGRGPLAGPVVCAAILIPDHVAIDGMILDSKVIKETDREVVFETIMKNKEILWGISIVSHIEIDELNILQASLLGMRRATISLMSKSKSLVPTQCIALIDGNKIPSEMPIHAEHVIKGDSCVFSIAAASILAKVTRDRIMVKLDAQYPQYGLAKHKGYPTLHHRSALMEHGPSEIHRMTYAPVKAAALHRGSLKATDIRKESSENLIGGAGSVTKRSRSTHSTESPEDCDNFPSEMTRRTRNMKQAQVNDKSKPKSVTCDRSKTSKLPGSVNVSRRKAKLTLPAGDQHVREKTQLRKGRAPHQHEVSQSPYSARVTAGLMTAGRVTAGRATTVRTTAVKAAEKALASALVRSLKRKKPQSGSLGQEDQPAVPGVDAATQAGLRRSARLRQRV